MQKAILDTSTVPFSYCRYNLYMVPCRSGLQCFSLLFCVVLFTFPNNVVVHIFREFMKFVLRSYICVCNVCVENINLWFKHTTIVFFLAVVANT